MPLAYLSITCVKKIIYKSKSKHTHLIIFFHFRGIQIVILVPSGTWRICESVNRPMHSICVSWPTGAHIRRNKAFLTLLNPENQCTEFDWLRFIVLVRIHAIFYAGHILVYFRCHTCNKHLACRASNITSPSGMSFIINSVTKFAGTLPTINITF